MIVALVKLVVYLSLITAAGATYLVAAGTEAAVITAACVGTGGGLALGATAAATTATSTAVMGGAGVAGVVAGIQTGAVSASAFFTCIPFLP